MAPIPKPPGARRRRNLIQKSWAVLPSEGRRGQIPELPGGDWLDSTIAWWNVIWRSPMATIWEDADIDALVRLARLRDDFRRGELPVSALGAMQQLEDRFGLSPKARRQLQWEISRSEASESQTAGAKATPRTLRAVDAGAA